MSEPPAGPREQPVTHRRQPGLLGRTARRAGTLLLVVATVAIGYEIIVRTPDRGVVAGYFLRTGGVGERVEALDFAATVTSVRGATAIVERDGDELHTNGVFVLVAVRVDVPTEPEVVSYAGIYDRRQRTFDATTRLSQPMLGYEVQPGLPVEGEIVFEVPRDAVPQARLRMYNGLLAGSSYQTVIDIDLNVDLASLDRWLTVEEPLRPAEPEVSA